MKNNFEIKIRWGCFFCKLWPGKTSGFHVRYRFKVIPWRATGESPFEYVDVYKYTQEIRRNVWKLRMERWMMKVLTLLGLKFSSKKMSPAKSTYQVCCIPYSNKFASIWPERECFSYKCWCEGDKDSYLTTSLFIVQFLRYFSLTIEWTI